MAFRFFASQRQRRELGESLYLRTLAARGDPKRVEKILKELKRGQ